MSPAVRDVFTCIGVWTVIGFGLIVIWVLATEVARRWHR